MEKRKMSTTFEIAFEGVLWSLPGGLAGILSVFMLWWSVHLTQPGPNARRKGLRPWIIQSQVVAGYALRLGIVATLLIWPASKGIGPLLWAFAGLVVSRWVTISLMVAGEGRPAWSSTRSSDQTPTQSVDPTAPKGW